ncbi:MAG: hypothetical protein QXG05_05795 [Nitrososphaerota archaeon]
MSTINEFPRVAHTLSLVAGILMVVSSAITVIGSMFFVFYAPITSTYYGHMIMYSYIGRPYFMFGFMAILGLISGIVVLISALMLRKKLTDYTTWGILIIIFSILSFFGMGGFVIGAVLGIIGGAMAVSFRPT